MTNPTSSLELSHFPVMLEEVIKICSPQSGGVYVDCTFGAGVIRRKFFNTRIHKLSHLTEISSF